MPDAPDLYQYLASSEKKPLTDLGELAPRLFSPDVYDRGGVVLFIDDFRYGIAAFDRVVAVTGSIIRRSTARYQKGGASAWLTCSTTANATAAMTVWLHPQSLVNLGFEVGLALINNFDFVLLRVSRFDGTNEHRSEIKLQRTPAEVQYLDGAGAYQKTQDLPSLISTKNVFHAIKLIADMSGGKYVRLKLDNNSWSLSGIANRTIADTTIPSVSMTVLLDGLTGTASQAFLDYVICTMDEPS